MRSRLTRRCGSVWRSELGLEPGEQLRSAQAAVLKADSVTAVAGAVPRTSCPPAASADTIAWPRARARRTRGPAEHPGGAGGDDDRSGWRWEDAARPRVGWRATGSRELAWVRWPAPVGRLGVADARGRPGRQGDRRATGEADLIRRMARMIRGRDLLLCLDNFEHLLEASTALAELLGAADESLQVLVTSREALRIGGEHVYLVGPLASFGIDGEPPSAVTLFWERAEAANPRFVAAAIKTRSRRSVADSTVCRWRSSAAARTNLLDPTTMVARLASRLTLLTAGTRDAPARQRSLRACLSWSVDLLNEDERRLFAAMAVFAGGVTLTSLEAVCADALSGVDPLATIDSLVAKSLARSVDGPSRTRLWMLETIREYASELLVGSDAEDAVRLAHARQLHDTPCRQGNASAVAATDRGAGPRAIRRAAQCAHCPANTDGGRRNRLYADLVEGLRPLGASMGTNGTRTRRVVGSDGPFCRASHRPAVPGGTADRVPTRQARHGR